MPRCAVFIAEGHAFSQVGLHQWPTEKKGSRRAGSCRRVAFSRRNSRTQRGRIGPIRREPQSRPAENDSLLEGMRFELLVPGKNVMSADADRGHTPAAAFGYLDEMNATEEAIAAGRADELPRYLTDRWLVDCIL